MDDMNESLRRREPVAVVGISALCPGDPTTDGFLSVMMEGRDQIRDVPASRFSKEDFGTPDAAERGDRTYCTRGAFIDAVAFDPMAFGVPPSVVAATDSAQLLTLLKAHELLEDSGIGRWGASARERVGVILGAQGMTQLQALMMSRVQWPEWVAELRAMGLGEAEARAAAARFNERRPGWQEMSFPGFLGNITAGRVTNRLDLGGTNYVVDAACASSLAAISAALNELYLGQCDAVITGGCDLLTDAGTFLSFANSTALSRTGDCRPFSTDADGTVIGEGVALLALRRLADAERDGDAVHAVIRGHGTASDGRGSAIYAPRSEGQVRAMERAYEAAGYGPESVGLVEAHGTGTGLGDATEVRSMTEVFGRPGRTRRAALGSVKSLIGHPKTSAGAVSLLKVVTALRHGVLPPTLKVGTPNEALAAEGCPVHPNTVARPWISGSDAPRRAGLSAFGFGGTNAHVTVEEYRGAHRAVRRLPLPAQLLLFSGPSREAVLAGASEAAERAGRGAALDGLARASQRAFDPAARARLGLVARDPEALAATLARVSALCERTGALPPGFEGASYAEGPAEPGRVAFLFPGQGSQRVGMTGELAMHFEAARAPWDAEDAAARERGETPLHELVFPDPALTDDEARNQEARLRATEAAQPALAVATLAVLALAEALELRPELSLGHSFGEVMALHAAGAFDAAVAVRIARERGRLMREAGDGTDGAMTSLALDAGAVEELLARSGADVRVANRNAPRQIVVSGPVAEIERLEALCPPAARRRLPVSTAFHSPVVADAAPRFGAFLDTLEMVPPCGTVVANATAEPYPDDVGACRELLASQIASEVRFHESVRTAFDAGARTFVEVGPGSVLSRLATQCLEGEPAEVVPLGGGAGVAGLLDALARLAARGVPLRLEALWEDRRVGSEEPPAPLKPHVVWVDSTMKRRTEAERLAGVEPRIVGARPEDSVPPAAPFAVPPTEPTSPTEPAAMTAMTTEPAVPNEPIDSVRDREPRRPTGAEALLFEVSAVQERFLATMADSHGAYLGMVTSAVGSTVHADARADAWTPVTSIAPERVARAAEAPEAAVPSTPAPTAPATAPPPTGPMPLAEPPGELPKDLEVAATAVVAQAPRASVQGSPAPEADADPTEVLLEIVAEATGYPADMLETSMELEADLGIDSIKRMEILMALGERLPGRLPPPEEVDMAAVAALVTLADVADHLRGAGRDPEPDPGRGPERGPGREPGRAAAASAPASAGPIREIAGASANAPRVVGDGRAPELFVPALAPAPAGGDGALLRPGEESTVHVMPDGAGLAEALVHGLRERGVAAGIVPAPGAGTSRLILLAGPDADPSSLEAHRAAFAAVRAAAPGLRAGGVVVSVQDIAGPAGLGAMLLSAAKEWPDVRVKAVRLDGIASPEDAANAVVAELLDGGPEPQVVLGDGARRVPVLRRASVAPSASGGAVDERSVVVVSGGARGVAAACAEALARRHRPRLVLVGRTPLAPEPDALEEAGTEAALKAAILAEARERGETVELAEVGRRAAAVLAAREARARIARIEAAGSEVTHVAADVRDAAALAEALAGVRERWGPITGVVHAAGVIADRRIEDKAPETFAEVFATKVAGFGALLEATADDPLRLIAAFSSIAARFGSAGQVDYAAANAVLGAMARREARSRGGRCLVRAVEWGPWEGGMVTPALARRMREAGLTLLGIEAGGRVFCDLVDDPGAGDVETVVTDGSNLATLGWPFLEAPVVSRVAAIAPVAPIPSAAASASRAAR